MVDARIVVVEDEQIVSKDIQARLQSFGYEVAGAAASGEDAVALVADTHPDLVLMDVMLKGEMMGTEAAEIVREKYNVPVVYLTAYADRDTLENAKITEPYGYVLKPFDERELQTAIEMALYKYEAEQEKLRLKEHLMQVQKLEAIGHLTTGVAHNFNNALNVITGNLELARLKSADEVTAYLNRAMNAAVGAAKLVEGLLTFCSNRELDAVDFDVRDVVKQAGDMGRQLAKGAIEIELSMNEAPCFVSGEPTQIQQVILNLCLNARDAILSRTEYDRDPKIEIDVRHVDRDQKPFACIAVKDNGIGMSEEVQAHIFEPFFTTKAVDEGTGLGLATAFGIVQDHQGWIACESAVGVGTTFEVYLPLVEGDDAEVVLQDEPEAEVRQDSVSPKPTARILIVDDEEMVRDTTKDLLEFEGYEVLTAVDGLDGWEKFQAEADRIDLVLLDLSMPKMSGFEVLDRIMDFKRDTRVAIITGDPPHSVDAPKARMVIGKPLFGDMLFDAVHKALNDDV